MGSIEIQDKAKNHGTLSVDQLCVVKAVVGYFVEKKGEGIDVHSLFDFYHSNIENDFVKITKSKFDKALKSLKGNAEIFLFYKGDLSQISNLHFLKFRLAPTPEVIERYSAGSGKELFWYPNGNDLPLPLTLKKTFIQLAIVLNGNGLNNISKGQLSKVSGVTEGILSKTLPIFSYLNLLEVEHGTNNALISIKSIKLTSDGLELAKIHKIPKCKPLQETEKKLSAKEEAFLLVVEEDDHARDHLLPYFKFSSSVNSIFSRLVKKGYLEKLANSQKYIITALGTEYLDSHRNEVEIDKDYVLMTANTIEDKSKRTSKQATPSMLLSEIRKPIKAKEIKDIYAQLDIMRDKGDRFVKYLFSKELLKLVNDRSGEKYILTTRQYDKIKAAKEQKKSAQQQPQEK